MTADGKIFLPLYDMEGLNSEALGDAAALRSAEVVGRDAGQPRRSAADASDARSPCGDGKEVGKGERAADRTNPWRRITRTTAVISPRARGETRRDNYPDHCGQPEQQPGHSPRQARRNGLA